MLLFAIRRSSGTTLVLQASGARAQRQGGRWGDRALRLGNRARDTFSHLARR